MVPLIYLCYQEQTSRARFLDTNPFFYFENVCGGSKAEGQGMGKKTGLRGRFFPGIKLKGNLSGNKLGSKKLGEGGCLSISRNSCILVSGRELNVCPDVCPRFDKTPEGKLYVTEKVTSELATKIAGSFENNLPFFHFGRLS